MSTITPKGLTQFIHNFCEEICPVALPVYIPVKPVIITEYAEFYDNVKKKIEKSGGSFQYGWTIWEWENILMEAEFHMVWRSPEGNLVCVSQNPYRESKLLFLPDSSRDFVGREKIDSFRKSIRIEPIVDEYIDVKKQFFTEYLEQRGKKDLSPKLVELARKDYELRLAIEKLPPLPGWNNTCLCGSNRRYKDCCGAIHRYLE